VVFHYCNSAGDDFLHNLWARPGAIVLSEFLDPLGISAGPGRQSDGRVAPPYQRDRAPQARHQRGDTFFVSMGAHYHAKIAREHLASEVATIERIA
jgi:hypothetical protein